MQPIAPRLGRHVHPTMVTLVAFGVGVAASLCLWQRAYGWGLALWLLNRAVDGLDGSVARASGKQSDLGGYLDILLDTVIYAAVPVALVAARPDPATLWALVALLASFYVNSISWSYLAAILEKRQHGAAAHSELTSVTMPTGLIEGTETVLFFTAFILFPSALVVLFGLMGALVALTTVQRVVWAVRTLDRRA